MLRTEEKIISLSGVYGLSTDSGKLYDLRLPGTLDESSIGEREGTVLNKPEGEEISDFGVTDDGFFEELILESEQEDTQIRDRFVRKYDLEGTVRIFRMISFHETQGKRLFLEAERARELRLFVDDEEIMPFQPVSLTVPYVFEVTGKLDGDHMLTMELSNSYDNLPKESILRSDTASSETQTNWNGIIGGFFLREEEAAFITRTGIKRTGINEVSIEVEISSDSERSALLEINSDILQEEIQVRVPLIQGKKIFRFDRLLLLEDTEAWDLNQGNLYEFSFSLDGFRKTELTGFRTFGNDHNGRLLLNGRRIFLRAESEYSVFPEAGHEPMDYDSWKKRLSLYRKYGCNAVRFVSHCPCEACFQAADDLGMIIIAELSSKDGPMFESEKSRIYYEKELVLMLRNYGNHPSLAVISFGDHLVYDEDTREYARELLKKAVMSDSNRLFTIGGSTSFDSEFTIEDGNIYLGSPESAPKSQDIPVILTDQGQFEMLPDFNEIDHFSGVLEPELLLNMKKNAEEKGLLGGWQRYLNASGERAFSAYRKLTERLYLNQEISGLCICALQDYPGKKGHFFGMMNSHLISKPGSFSDPVRFSSFFSDFVPVAVIDRYTYEYGEMLEADVFLVNYTGEDFTDSIKIEIRGDEFLIAGQINEKTYPSGRATAAGHFRAELRKTMDEDPEEPLDIYEAYEVVLTVNAGKKKSSYPLFIYPSLIPLCPDSVMESDSLTVEAVNWLKEGGTLFLTPKEGDLSEKFSIKTEFTAAGNMDTNPTFGLLIEEDSPAFYGFPTLSYGDARWEDMASSYAVILSTLKKSLIYEMDSALSFRPLSRLFEARVLNGNVLFSSLCLKEKMERPEVRALLQSLYDYMESYDFSPVEEITLKELSELFKDS